MFRKFIVASALALCAATSFASTVILDTNGLSDAQILELKAHAAKIVADAANQPVTPSVSTPSAALTIAATWGQQAAAAAEGFAKALGIAAKELGVTVNDFLHTDAGKLTAILIIWKVAGATIIHMLIGLFVIMIGLIMTRVIYTGLFTKGYEKVEYSRFGGLFKGTKMVRIPKGFHDLENDGEWLAFWIMLAVFIISLSIGVSII
jgi:hypothetical protein